MPPRPGISCWKSSRFNCISITIIVSRFWGSPHVFPCWLLRLWRLHRTHRQVPAPHAAQWRPASENCAERVRRARSQKLVLGPNWLRRIHMLRMLHMTQNPTWGRNHNKITPSMLPNSTWEGITCTICTICIRCTICIACIRCDKWKKNKTNDPD